jgi:hypothetical protein
MNREELDELLLFRQRVDQESDVFLFGPFGILIQFPDLPPDIEAWFETEMFPRQRFTPDAEFMGAFAHAAESESLLQSDVAYRPQEDEDELTAEMLSFPSGWLERMIPAHHSHTGESLGATTLEAHDWAVGQLVRGSEQHLELVRRLLRYGLLDEVRLRELLPTISAGEAAHRFAEERLAHLFDAG